MILEFSLLVKHYAGIIHKTYITIITFILNYDIDTNWQIWDVS